MLTPEEFKHVMTLIADDYDGDPETAHELMDAMMVELLSDLGYKDGIDIFHKAMKWYS